MKPEGEGVLSWTRLKTTGARKKRDWRVLPPYDRPINSFRIPRNREVHPRPASFSRTLSSRPLALHRLLIRYWTSLEHSALRIYQPFFSYLQFPHHFFPILIPATGGKSIIVPFFFSLSFLFLPFLAPFSRKNSSFSISFLPQNGISSRPCEARASIQILIKARPREKCMRLKSTRLRFEGRPRLNRSSIVFLFFPFFSPSPLSIWLRFCSSCFRQNPRALIIENHCNPISLLGGAI